MIYAGNPTVCRPGMVLFFTSCSATRTAATPWVSATRCLVTEGAPERADRPAWRPDGDTLSAGWLLRRLGAIAAGAAGRLVHRLRHHPASARQRRPDAARRVRHRRPAACSRAGDGPERPVVDAVRAMAGRHPARRLGRLHRPVPPRRAAGAGRVQPVRRIGCRDAGGRLHDCAAGGRARRIVARHGVRPAARAYSPISAPPSRNLSPRRCCWCWSPGPAGCPRAASRRWTRVSASSSAT